MIDAPSPTRRRHGSGQLRLAGLLLGLLAAMAAAPQLFTRMDPEACRLSDSLRAPSREHLFGFDLQGCDQLAQTIHGARTSLGVAVLVIAGTVAIALVLGSLAGVVGGRTDTVLSRVTDVWAAIPLVLGGVLLLSGTERRGPLELAAVLVLFSWPPMVRVLRAGVVQQRDREHVLAARALGARPLRVLVRHVLPGSVRPLLVLASAYAGVVVAAEATLTFAGVGLARPVQSWGVQLFEAQHRLAQAPHLLLPGAFVVAAVTGFVLLGEALRERPGVDAL